jgi:hypothetical protein
MCRLKPKEGCAVQSDRKHPTQSSLVGHRARRLWYVGMRPGRLVKRGAGRKNQGLSISERGGAPDMRYQGKNIGEPFFQKGNFLLKWPWSRVFLSEYSRFNLDGYMTLWPKPLRHSPSSTRHRSQTRSHRPRRWARPVPSYGDRSTATMSSSTGCPSSPHPSPIRTGL